MSFKRLKNALNVSGKLFSHSFDKLVCFKRVLKMLSMDQDNYFHSFEELVCLMVCKNDAQIENRNRQRGSFGAHLYQKDPKYIINWQVMAIFTLRSFVTPF